MERTDDHSEKMEEGVRSVGDEHTIDTGHIGVRKRQFPQQAKDDPYTLDNSVDLKGNRSIRAKSGGWRSCPFILGLYKPLSNYRCSFTENRFSGCFLNEANTPVIVDR
jgi:hypothetical protein